MALLVGVIARPPRAVQRSSRGICSETVRAEATTSSNGITSAKPAKAMLAQARALVAAITFLPRHGTSTRLATGSQIRPSMLCSAMEAAASDCSRVPSARVTRPAAAIAAADPPSAWQPPTSAANDQADVMKIPIRPAASNARAIASSSRPRLRATTITAAGRAAQAPAVGAATITPIELFTSIRAVVASTIWLRVSSPSRRPAVRAA